MSIPDELPSGSATHGAVQRQVSNVSMPKVKSGIFGTSSNLVNSIVGAGMYVRPTTTMTTLPEMHIRSWKALDSHILPLFLFHNQSYTALVSPTPFEMRGLSLESFYSSWYLG